VDSAATESEYLGCEGPLKESLSDDNAPIICHEELGIPPLAEGNSADLCSEEEAFLSLKTDSSGNVSFDQVFRASDDRHLVETLKR